MGGGGGGEAGGGVMNKILFDFSQCLLPIDCSA